MDGDRQRPRKLETFGRLDDVGDSRRRGFRRMRLIMKETEQ
jgi:hypothetical protein